MINILKIVVFNNRYMKKLGFLIKNILNKNNIIV